MGEELVNSKVTGPYSTGTVLLDLSGLKEGDFAGNGIMGRMMYQFGVRKKDNRFWLEMREGNRDAAEMIVDSLELNDVQRIYLRTETTKEGATRFHYSLIIANIIVSVLKVFLISGDLGYGMHSVVIM